MDNQQMITSTVWVLIWTGNEHGNITVGFFK